MTQAMTDNSTATRRALRPYPKGEPGSPRAQAEANWRMRGGGAKVVLSDEVAQRLMCLVVAGHSIHCPTCRRWPHNGGTCLGLAPKTNSVPLCHIDLDGKMASPLIDDPDNPGGLMLAPGQEFFYRAGKLTDGAWATVDRDWDRRDREAAQ